MKDKNKKELKLLGEKEVREWIDLVLKVNNRYELDEKELYKLGNGLVLFDISQMPEDIKLLVNNAKKYFENNKNEFHIK